MLTTYDAARLRDVEQALDSLHAQTYTNLEIIFVGENSRRLCNHITSYARERKIPNVKAVFNDGPPGLSPARNVGVGHAAGEIIAFIDDDATAFPDWTEQIAGAFAADNDAVAVTGPVYPAWEDDSMSWFPEEFLWILSCTMPTGIRDGKPRRVRNAWGVNMSFRREAFDHCRFSEKFVGGNQGSSDNSKMGLLGDDTELCLRLNARMGRPVVFSHAVRVYHKVHRHRLTPRFIHRRAFWEGYTKAVLAKRFAGDRARKMDMTAEYSLLRSILFRFFPRSIVQIPRHPRLMGRRLLLAVDVLFHVALGYFAASFPAAGDAIAGRYSR